MSDQKLMAPRTAGQQSLPIRLPHRLAGLCFAMLVTALSAPVFAQSSCETDMKRIKDRYDAVVASLNALKKGGKIDAAAACPKLRALSNLEVERINYLTKNKDWCGVSDDLLASMGAQKAKTAAYAGQACSVAARNKKMQEQQAAGGGGAAQPQVRLPAGPL
jgi:hypothetical protein